MNETPSWFTEQEPPLSTSPHKKPLRAVVVLLLGLLVVASMLFLFFTNKNQQLADCSPPNNFLELNRLLTEEQGGTPLETITEQQPLYTSYIKYDLEKNTYYLTSGLELSEFITIANKQKTPLSITLQQLTLNEHKSTDDNIKKIEEILMSTNNPSQLIIGEEKVVTEEDEIERDNMPVQITLYPQNVCKDQPSSTE